MAEFITRMFTPSKSDNQSGADYNAAYNAQQQAEAKREPRPEPVSQRAKKKTVTKFGGAKTKTNLLDDEATLARKTLLGQ